MENRRLTAEELQIWQRFTQDIASPNLSVQTQSERITPKIKIGEFSESKQEASSPTSLAELLPGDTSQISGASLRQIKKNQSRPDATLDLHGYTQEQALQQFQQFIRQSSDRGLRLLRVITGYGKITGGQGVLRSALPKWINYPENRPFILSYQQARPQDGGAGAWLLLLRRKERL